MFAKTIVELSMFKCDRMNENRSLKKMYHRLSEVQSANSLAGSHGPDSAVCLLTLPITNTSQIQQSI